MLGWIKNSLRKWLEVETVPSSTPPVIPSDTEKIVLPEGSDLFQPEQRLIFSYFDGTTTLVKADPMVLYRKMMEVGPELSVDISVARSASKDADVAYDKMLTKIRKVFGTKLFEEGGLTESETVALFDKFNIYCEEIQKKTKNLVTSQTETPSTSQPFIPGGPLTPNGSASGSTANAPSTAGQRPSSSV